MLKSKSSLGFRALSDAGIKYAGIGGESKLLDNQSRDIDIVVFPNQLERALECLISIYSGSGWLLIKIIRNEYATQLFFAFESSSEYRFLQWDVMPCLTWRGFEILDVETFLLSGQSEGCLTTAGSHATAVYKGVRGAMCDPRRGIRPLDQFDENLMSNKNYPSWYKEISKLDGYQLKRKFYLKRGQVDIFRVIRFYFLNVLRFFNPPGLVVSIDDHECDVWVNCYDVSTKEENAFPYTGIVNCPTGRQNLLARISLLRELYLGKIVVLAGVKMPCTRRRLFFSRALSFLFAGKVDAVIERNKKECSKHSSVVRNIVETSREIFVKNEVS